MKQPPPLYMNCPWHPSCFWEGNPILINTFQFSWQFLFPIENVKDFILLSVLLTVLFVMPYLFSLFLMGRLLKKSFDWFQRFRPWYKTFLFISHIVKKNNKKYWLIVMGKNELLKKPPWPTMIFSSSLW